LYLLEIASLLRACVFFACAWMVMLLLLRGR
jgi:hypothetical protein